MDNNVNLDELIKQGWVLILKTLFIILIILMISFICVFCMVSLCNIAIVVEV